jgi:uncharacterized repeat protein (TIGR03943 family)
MVAAVTKSAQNLLLILLGAAVLWITLATDDYLNYVRPWFRLMLVPAGLAIIVLGGAGLRSEWRDGLSSGHAGPRVAWLMCLPAVTIFLVAPPALGAFTASRDSGRVGQPLPPPSEGYAPLPVDGAPAEMTLSEFINRATAAQSGDPASLRARPVRLTGLVTSRAEGDWYLTRLRLNCCAGDAVPLRVVVRGRPRPPEDTWVQVVGTWDPPAPGGRRPRIHELGAQAVRPIAEPEIPYEP